MKGRPDIVWTKDRTAQLLRLHRAGLSQRAIAEQMGISHDKVASKCHRMGLSRENPGQANPKLAKQRQNNRKNREYKPKFENAKPKKRKCLGCKTIFLSEWNGERVCKRCKDTQPWRDGAMPDHKVHLRGRAG